jgi:hypothetical protein
VEYALREQAIMKQVKAAKSAGAAFVLTLHDAGGLSWNPNEAPPEWTRLVQSGS